MSMNNQIEIESIFIVFGMNMIEWREKNNKK